MQADEVYDLLTSRIRRGAMVARGIWYCSMVVIVVGLAIPTGRPWVVAAILAAMLVYRGSIVTTRVDATGRRIADTPDLVYWAHPHSGLPNVSALKLHLLDGTDYEVLLPAPQMRD